MRPQDLQNIGLSEKEAAVYLALLELGSDTVQNIAQKAKVNRTTTYVILDALAKKGIVSTMDKGKAGKVGTGFNGKTHFSAESPEALLRLIRLEEAEVQTRKKELHAMLPQLKGVYNLAENKPVVRFYEGKEGLKAMHDEFLRSPVENIEMIYSRDDVEFALSAEELMQARKDRQQKGKKVRALYT